eukprot:TRINITY_DN1305_c0_g1_i2.p1 TRINITY_DN1305_c0_g1~~TRINITY_DN1305_c0_g1_i2.p1  ORF type:complete len:241 (+),score=36.53 TRINITY_DN1305_c0_g1_i2:230-952(+)
MANGPALKLATLLVLLGTFASADDPTPDPTITPTQWHVPSSSPTFSPTEDPTDAPSFSPTLEPTEFPTFSPTEGPTKAPTFSPTKAPTTTPTTSAPETTKAKCHSDDHDDDCTALVGLYEATNQELGRTGWANGTTLCDWPGVTCDYNTNRVTQVWLEYNNITGSVPDSLAGLSWLRTLYIDNNYLSGTLPPGLGNLEHLKTMSPLTLPLTLSFVPNLGPTPRPSSPAARPDPGWWCKVT